MQLTLHKDPKVFRMNEIPARSYFIPYESAEASKKKRERSAYFYSLNGEWRFRYERSLYDMDDFYINGFDVSGFETAELPECWQTHGFDRAQYQSSPYTFPFDPPYVPEKNPCAAYVKDFDYKKSDGKRYELHFEGKDSCVYVWLNGEFIGYGEAPHNDSAFDVTRNLRNGHNRLCVLVLKWCSGSYLDDQDKIRMSGIFREVYLLERAENGVRDFMLTVKNDGAVSVHIESASNARVWVEKDGITVCGCDVLCEKNEMKVDDPSLWSAETPALYELYIECAGEVIRQSFGFREVCVKDGVFTVNGRAVKLYGVNRHDFSPITGYAVDTEFIKKELILMKRHNINAIRTSHYPNDPRFYQMCNELGFYVMSEADMECHGCTYVDGWQKILEEPTYAEAIHDRIYRMYGALKNFSCICIWSLGNESSWGENLKNEAVYIKSVDKSRPLHYEGWCGGGGDAGDGYNMSEEDVEFIKKYIDLHSRMYPALEKMKRIFENDRFGLPFIMCEYSHAMGNSCGDLRFYDDIIQSDARFAGGFVWEWCDHALTLTDGNGKEYFGYGGDFGEHHHLGNVCMDGTVAPDREPHSSLLELKAVYSPLRVTRNGSELIFYNRSVFTDLIEHDIFYAIESDTEVLSRGELTVACAPGESAAVSVPTDEPYDCENAHLKVKVCLKADTAWAEKGHEIGVFSIPLTVKERTRKCEKSETPPSLTESPRAYCVKGEGFAYVFRKDEGILTQIEVGGEELLCEPMSFCCFRAPTDNDNTFQTARNVYLQWHKTFNFGNIEYPELSVRELKAETGVNYVRLFCDFMLSVQGRKPISKGKLEFKIYGDGTLDITQNAEISTELPYWLPRYGYALSFEKPLSDIEYYGYGPAECYEDKRTHATLGRYTYIQDEPRGAYENPQERGSRCDTKWVSATVGNADIRVTGESFSFCASRFDVHETANSLHRKDMKCSDGTHLYIDYRMSGVGSASCGGQAPVPECRIEPGENVGFKISIKVRKK